MTRYHYIKTLGCTIFFGLCLFLPSLQAAEVRLSEVEQYLKTLDNVMADFEQWDANGAYKKGQLFLQKPGKIRLNYQRPSKLVVLGDGQTLFFADHSSGDLSYMPIEQSPASFLLSKHIDIEKQFHVSAFTYDQGIVSLTLKQKENEDIGSLNLKFQKSKNTMVLTQWVVTDPQGKKVIVKLQNLRQGATLDAVLFDSSVLQL